MPLAHTMYMPPTLRARNGSGAGEVTVTVPAVSSAVAVAPGGTNRPRLFDAFFGLPTKLMFAATWVAVSGGPSEQVMPLRIVYVAFVPVSVQLAARPGTILPSLSMPVSES